MDRQQQAAEFRNAARSLQRWIRQNGVIRSQDMAKQKELQGLIRAVDQLANVLGIQCPEIRRKPEETPGTPIGRCGVVHRPGRTTTAIPDNCSDAWILDGGAQWSRAIDDMVFAADQITKETTQDLPWHPSYILAKELKNWMEKKKIACTKNTVTAFIKRERAAGRIQRKGNGPMLLRMDLFKELNPNGVGNTR